MGRRKPRNVIEQRANLFYGLQFTRLRVRQCPPDQRDLQRQPDPLQQSTTGNSRGWDVCDRHVNICREHRNQQDSQSISRSAPEARKQQAHSPDNFSGPAHVNQGLPLRQNGRHDLNIDRRHGEMHDAADDEDSREDASPDALEHIAILPTAAADDLPQMTGEALRKRTCRTREKPSVAFPTKRDHNFQSLIDLCGEEPRDASSVVATLHFSTA